MAEIPPPPIPPPVGDQPSHAKRGKRWAPTKEDQDAILEAYVRFQGNLTTEQLLQVGDRLGQSSQRIRNYINNHKPFLRGELQKRRSQMKPETIIATVHDRMEPFASPTSIDGKPAQVIYSYAHPLQSKDVPVPFPSYYPHFGTINQYALASGIPQQPIPQGIPAGMTQQVTYAIPGMYQQPGVALPFDPVSSEQIPAQYTTTGSVVSADQPQPPIPPPPSSSSSSDLSSSSSPSDVPPPPPSTEEVIPPPEQPSTIVSSLPQPSLLPLPLPDSSPVDIQISNPASTIPKSES